MFLLRGLVMVYIVYMSWAHNGVFMEMFLALAQSSDMLSAVGNWVCKNLSPRPVNYINLPLALYILSLNIGLGSNLAVQ